MSNPHRFEGEGVVYRAKLIGVLEVSGPRGDPICQEALSELKVAVRAAGEHKQRIFICIGLDGIRLRDERSGVSFESLGEVICARNGVFKNFT